MNAEPIEYVPAALRPKKRRSLEYAMGSLDGNGGVGISHGPSSSLSELLNHVPTVANSVIIRLNEDNTDDFIYKWLDDKWVRTDPDLEYIKNFDWDVNKLQPMIDLPKLPVSLGDVQNIKETAADRIMRMLRQVERTVRSCSMCELGRKLCTERDTTFDPHVFSNMKFSRFMVVGQNPGFNECLTGVPFVGDAGKFFDECLSKNGLSRDNFYICNTVRCHTLNNQCPTQENMDRCEPFLRIEINLLRPILVITLGQVAFSAFVPNKEFSKSLGQIVYSEKFKINVYALYHPSPRNMNDSARRNKFMTDISDMCELIQELKKRTS
jgi:DNA polymerase